MNIHVIQVGENATNCYIVNFENNNSFIVDPGADEERIMEYIEDQDYKVKGIVLTHGHFDHIGAVSSLRNKYDVELAVHRLDNPMLSDPQKNLSSYIGGGNIEIDSAECLLSDGDYYNGFQIIATPGHTAGGISLYKKDEKILFSGDTIFRNAYGRTDFPGANQQILFTSINKLIKLPEDTVVYSGHGPTTTIGDFKRYIG